MRLLVDHSGEYERKGINPGFLLWWVLSGPLFQQPRDMANRYPNELPGYQLYAEGNWKALLPYVSRQEDVHQWLGKESPVLIDYGANWQVIVFYFGSATRNGKPYGTAFKDTISSINFRPRQRVSFRDVKFPRVFKCSAQTRSDSIVSIYKRCSDGSGLAYILYGEGTPGGNILAGDLAEIEYGPSDEMIKWAEEQP